MEYDKEREEVVITFKDAIAMRLDKYFTGVPCVQGHTSERLTSSGKCVDCVRNSDNKVKSIKSDNGRRDKRKQRAISSYKRGEGEKEYSKVFTARLTEDQYNKIKQQQYPSEYIRGLINSDIASSKGIT